MKHWHVKRDRAKAPSTWAAIPQDYPAQPPPNSPEADALALISFLEAHNHRLRSHIRQINQIPPTPNT